MDNLKGIIGHVVKVVIFLVLLAIFCVLYLLPVVTQYSEKLTNMAKSSKTADKIEVPSFSICTGWKTSIINGYKFKSKFFFTPKSNESNLPTDATIRTVYSDITYKLNEDFVIGLAEGDEKKPKALMVGTNEIVSGEAVTKYDVKEVSTINQGMCYVILPNEIFMSPYLDHLTLIIAKNSTSKEDKMDKVMMQISSKDTFPAIFATAPAVNNELITIDFDLQNEDNFLDIDYTEENTEYINDCNKMAFFKCYATKIAESEEFKCPKKCIPLIFQSLMDTIDHNIPRCETDEEHYCMVKTEASKIIFKLKSTCQKQCNYQGSKLFIQKSEIDYSYQFGSMQRAIRLNVLPDIVYNKEYLIYDDIGMFGSIGGSLGLF